MSCFQITNDVSEESRAGPRTRLCVILPSLDDMGTVGEVLHGISSRIEGIVETRLIVVDGGSTARTEALAAEAGARVVRHPAPRGVHGVFQSGVRAALDHGADVIVNIDDEGDFDPAGIATLVRPIISGETDLAICSRFTDPSLAPRMPIVERIGAAAVAAIVSRLAGSDFRDVTCSFWAFSREAAMWMNLFGDFAHTHEAFIDLAFKGLRIVEVPLSARGERDYGRSRGASSKARFVIRTAWIILSAFKDYRPLAFFVLLAVLIGLPGGVLGAFFGWHYLQTGSFSPHLWAGFASGFLLGLALLLLLVGIAVESQRRLRLTLERTLYLAKERYYGGRRPRS